MRAQILVKGMIIENRKSIDPRVYLEEKVGVKDPAILDSIKRPNVDDSLESMMLAFEALDDAKRRVAAIDDAKQIS